MTDIPDKWPVAAVLVWIATRDIAAFRIPAGKVQPNAPASCIFDRWMAANSGSGGTRPRLFFETVLPDPITLAEHYIRVFRHGAARELRPAEEVAQAAQELLARLNDGCLSAWQGETELTALTWTFTRVIFTRCRDIYFENYFNRADVERVWPSGSKTGPKLGSPSPKGEWWPIAEGLLTRGEVKNAHGATAEIGRRIVDMPKYRSYEPETVEDEIRDAVKAWRLKHPAA